MFQIGFVWQPMWTQSKRTASIQKLSRTAKTYSSLSVVNIRNNKLTFEESSSKRLGKLEVRPKKKGLHLILVGN